MSSCRTGVSNCPVGVSRGCVGIAFPAQRCFVPGPRRHSLCSGMPCKPQRRPGLRRNSSRCNPLFLVQGIPFLVRKRKYFCAPSAKIDS